MQEPFSYQLGEKVSTLLKHNVEGHVHFDPYTRGRYSTDASIYQIAPFGVVVPKTTQDLVSAVEIAANIISQYYREVVARANVARR